MSSCLCLQWVCVPFLLTNPHSLDISLTAYNETFQAPWVGTVELEQAGKWFDDFMLLVSGVGEVIVYTHRTKCSVMHRVQNNAVFTRGGGKLFNIAIFCMTMLYRFINTKYRYLLNKLTFLYDRKI